MKFPFSLGILWRSYIRKSKGFDTALQKVKEMWEGIICIWYSYHSLEFLQYFFYLRKGGAVYHTECIHLYQESPLALCGDSSLHRRQLHLHSRTKEMRLPAISAVDLLNAKFQQRTPHPPSQLWNGQKFTKGTDSSLMSIYLFVKDWLLIGGLAILNNSRPSIRLIRYGNETNTSI